jgi:hypothetical protein
VRIAELEVRHAEGNYDYNSGGSEPDFPGVEPGARGPRNVTPWCPTLNRRKRRSFSCFATGSRHDPISQCRSRFHEIDGQGKDVHDLPKLRYLSLALAADGKMGLKCSLLFRCESIEDIGPHLVTNFVVLRIQSSAIPA